jgi:hypothetical protein
MAIVPPNNVGRPVVSTSDLEDLAIALRFPDAVTLDNDPISKLGFHQTLPSVTDQIHHHRAASIRSGPFVLFGWVRSVTVALRFQAPIFPDD